MGFRSRAKRIIKPYVDVKTWSGYDDRKSSWMGIGDMARDIVKVPEPERTETFEEALARLNLSDADIKRRKRQFLYLTLLYAVLALCSMIYTVHLAWSQEIMTALLGTVVTLLLIGLAFKNHFWFFQIKHRKLGCTFSEWWNSKVEGRP